MNCGYPLEPPHRGGSYEYPQSIFWTEKKKNNVYPCKPQFYHIKKWGLRGGGQNNIVYVFMMDLNLPILHMFEGTFSFVAIYSVFKGN